MWKAEDEKGMFEIWLTPPGYILMGFLAVFFLLMDLIKDPERKKRSD